MHPLQFMLWVLTIFVALGCAAKSAELPIGVTNPNVTQDNIKQTICKSGWTKTVRPPVVYTNNLKKMQMKAWGLKGTMSLYEEDHYIPLELGGHPFATGNLNPQRWVDGACGAHVKDKSENLYKRKVCTGKLTLDEAQLEFAAKWEHCFAVR